MSVPLHVNLFKGHLDFLTSWRMGFKREHPKRSRWKCMVFLGLSFRSHLVSLLLYFICSGSHQGQPKFKGIGHRFHLLMEELQHARRARGMGNIVAAIFGKHNLPSLPSGRNNSHPSRMQNTSLQDFPEVLSCYRVRLSTKTQDLVILIKGPHTDENSRI